MKIDWNSEAPLDVKELQACILIDQVLKILDVNFKKIIIEWTVEEQFLINGVPTKKIGEWL